MPDSKKDVSPQELKILNATAIEALQGNFGADIQIRSTSKVIDHLLNKTLPNKDSVAAFDRVFDRTNPGYDKMYDRDSKHDLSDLVINPGIFELLNKLKNSTK